MIVLHKHRIVPGHVGGTYDDRNVVRVNTALHAFLHKMLWLEHGRWQDRIAWQVLSGMIGKEEGRIQAVAESSRQRWATDTEYRAKVQASQVTPEARDKKRVQANKLWSNPTFREKVRVAQVRRWSSSERRAIQSAKQKGNQHATGYKQTSTALAKIGAASRSQWQSFDADKRAQIIAKRVASRLRNKARH